MIASPAYSYSPPTDPFHHSCSHPHRTKPIFFSLLSDHQHSPDHIVEVPDHSPSIKPKPSPRLQRWSRARSLRSGRRLLLESRSAAGTADAPPKPKDVTMTSPSDDDNDVCLAERQGGKSIYMVDIVDVGCCCRVDGEGSGGDGGGGDEDIPRSEAEMLNAPDI